MLTVRHFVQSCWKLGSYGRGKDNLMTEATPKYTATDDLSIRLLCMNSAKRFMKWCR